jgi:hypothetical protein
LTPTPGREIIPLKKSVRVGLVMSKHWPPPTSEHEAVERLVDAFTGGEYVTQVNTSMSRLENYLRMAVDEGRKLEQENQRRSIDQVKARAERWSRHRRYLLVAALTVWSVLAFGIAMEERGSLTSHLLLWVLLVALTVVAVSALRVGLRWARSEPVFAWIGALRANERPTAVTDRAGPKISQPRAR